MTNLFFDFIHDFVGPLWMQSGLLPSLYAQLTCHFITGDAAVGENEVEFGLYFGLAFFRGYSYCQS